MPRDDDDDSEEGEDFSSSDSRRDDDVVRVVVSPSTMNATTDANATDSFLDFESAGGKLVPLDDGHVPETFRSSSSSSRGDDDDDRGGSTSAVAVAPPSLMVRYPLHEPRSAATSPSSPAVCVYDDVLPPSLTSAIHDATVDVAASTGGRPWGTYVTIDEADSFLRRRTAGDDDDEARPRKTEDGGEKAKDDEERRRRRRHDLSAAAVAHFLLRRVPLDPTGGPGRASSAAAAVVVPPDDRPPRPSAPAPSSSSRPLYDSEEFRRLAHGVAVWALSSDVDSSVRYHVDHAELLRYERNVLVPPLWAGTVQCTDFGDDADEGGGGEAGGGEGAGSAGGGGGGGGEEGGGGGMVGGEFAVNLGGWDHYLEHGYKGSKSGDDLGGWTPPPPSPRGKVHRDAETSWVTVPYGTNRGIIHEGHLPHLGAPVLRLPRDKSRVIVGFNVFGHDVGPEVRKAPEHSDAFRRRVKVLRAIRGSTAPLEGRIDLERVRNNKGLTKLLVLAKREKMKERWRAASSKLTEDIVSALLPPMPSSSSSSAIVVAGDAGERDPADADAEFGGGDDAAAGAAATASDLSKRFGRTDGSWPSRTDVEVHLDRMIRDGTTVVLVRPSSSSAPKNDDDGGSTTRRNGNDDAPSRRCVVRRRRRAPKRKGDDGGAESPEDDSIVYLEER